MNRRRHLARIAWIGSGALVVAIGGWWLRSTNPPLPLLKAGSAAPSFVLPRLEGGLESTGSLRGRVFLVHFWATWCVPCRIETPQLERLYRKLEGDGFDLLAVSLDSPDARQAVRAFRDEFGLTFPILLDPDQNVYRSYAASGLPETFLVDAHGRLAAHFTGPRDWKQPRFARAIETLLHSSARVSN